MGLGYGRGRRRRARRDRDLNEYAVDLYPTRFTERKLLLNTAYDLTDLQFLELLRQRNVELRSSDGRLRVSAPPGVLDAELQAELVRRKGWLLDHLKRNATARPLPPLEPRRPDQPVPLTFAQENIWLVDRFHPGNVAYNMPEAFLIEDEVDPAIFQTAVDGLVARHESLRTSVRTVHGEAMQSIAAWLSTPSGFTDLSDLHGEEQDRQLHEALREAVRQPFFLDHPPLIRFHLFRLARKRHVAFVNVHHIVADQWSMGILRSELIRFYAAAVNHSVPELAPLPIQYGDYAVWERQAPGNRIEEQIRYWKDRLRDAPVHLELPFSRRHLPMLSFAGATHPFTVSADTLRALRSLARAENASLYMTLLTTFAVLLYRYTGKEDFCIGSPVTGRSRTETEPLIGMFVNTLVLRCDLQGRPGFRELLRRIRETALGAYANKDVPFQRLVTELRHEREAGTSPLFQIMFALDSFMQPGTAAFVQVDTDPGIAKFDLTLQLTELPDSVSGWFEYRTDLFDAADIQNFAACFSVMLDAIARDPETSIADVPLLSAEERHRILVEWNDTAMDFEKGQTLHSLFEEQAERTPDATAARWESQRVSYRELEAHANRIAKTLIDGGVRREDPIGICMKRSPAMIAAMLGVLKAGGAYLPLDPAYPAQRLSAMVEDSGCRIVVTDASGAPEWLALTAGVANCEADGEAVAAASDARPEIAVNGGSLAYVMYTSGSTGRPKGVAIEHHSVVSLLHWGGEAFSRELLSGVLASTSICFDLSVFEIFLPLSQGGMVILADDLLQLPELAAREEVTLVNTVPSAAAALLRSHALPPSVRCVNLAGEPLTAELVQQLYAKSGVRDVCDLYGPTETTVYSTFARRRPDAAPTIGRPLANTRIYLLDENLQPVPTGVPGQIYIAGEGVARGYLKRPDLTAERFVPLNLLSEPERAYATGDMAKYRANGDIEYLGRMDQQIKLRGYRIELGEIEAVLRQHPAIEDAAVLLQKNAAQGDFLVACVVKRAGIEIDTAELAAHQQRLLPSWMTAGQIAVIDRIPVTQNGKINRGALAASIQIPRDEMRGPQPPRDRLERELVNLWEYCFDRRPIGIDDNFFDLGGHSLLAFRLFSEIQERMGNTFLLSVLFESPTIRQLARKVHEERWAQPASSLTGIREGGSRLPLYFVHRLTADIDGYRRLGEHLDAERPLYALQYSTMPAQRGKAADPPAMLADQLQSFQPKGPYLLGGASADAAMLLAVSAELANRQQTVERLVLIEDATHHGSAPASSQEERAGIFSKLRTRLTGTGRASQGADRIGGVLVFEMENSTARTKAAQIPEWVPADSRRIEIHRIAGRPAGLLAEPSVTEIAEILNRHLRETD
ncbi:non-ribosomal peptide synthetase [Paracidobacterium acidisoli]|uniref:Amino acid adenylation domain-containing protein n=1 Tax=Paracidobacterium acidisoli TaxID=2303751 RepID=A0A372ILJ4_9BACT|nr:non-ribosomal peptide synthetase [Paracidobacterium acidisoli]MBT9332216.1 amino acid adenylation domain-containing protein [Paracidobacterium acidisoli]